MKFNFVIEFDFISTHYYDVDGTKLFFLFTEFYNQVHQY